MAILLPEVWTILDSSSENLVSNFTICDNAKLEGVMEQFWLSERIPKIKVKASDEFQKVEQCFRKSVELENKQFYIDMPVVSCMNEFHLGDSFSVALQRFLSSEKRIKQNKLYFDQFKKLIEKYIASGHAKVVNLGIYGIFNGPVYFLAHQVIIKTSMTTKLNVVLSINIYQNIN